MNYLINLRFGGIKMGKNTKTEKTTKKGRKTKEIDYINTMEDEFKWNFLQHPDLKAAYAIGLLYNRVAKQQRKELNTRGLDKQMRYLFERLTRDNLIKIFAECNKVSFKIQSKTRSDFLGFDNIRSRVEELLAHFTNEAKEDEMSVAFMFGYDSVRRTWAKHSDE